MKKSLCPEKTGLCPLTIPGSRRGSRCLISPIKGTSPDLLSRASYRGSMSSLGTADADDEDLSSGGGQMARDKSREKDTARTRKGKGKTTNSAQTKVRHHVLKTQSL